MLLRTSIFILLLISNLYAENLNDCEWDNREGVSCLTISKTPNTSNHNNDSVIKKVLISKLSRLGQKILSICLS